MQPSQPLKNYFVLRHVMFCSSGKTVGTGRPLQRKLFLAHKNRLKFASESSSVSRAGCVPELTDEVDAMTQHSLMREAEITHSIYTED